VQRVTDHDLGRQAASPWPKTTIVTHQCLV